jgi:hypothetical protein
MRKLLLAKGRRRIAVERTTPRRILKLVGGLVPDTSGDHIVTARASARKSRHIVRWQPVGLGFPSDRDGADTGTGGSTPLIPTLARRGGGNGAF